MAIIPRNTRSLQWQDQALTNDVGKSPASQEESPQQAWGFQRTNAMNPGREECRINVPPGASKSIDTKSESSKYAMSPRFVPEQSGTP